MPERKLPMTARYTCIEKAREMLRDVLGRWIGKLCVAEMSGLLYYRQQVEDVTSECRTMNEFLTTLPLNILDDLNPLVVSDFVEELSSNYKSDSGFEGIDEELHNLACTNMLESVLLPSTTRFNKRIWSSSEQKLIIQTFNSTPNLTHLIFDSATDSDNSVLLASNIHHLTQLVSFTYKYQCTDQVVEQLALHCRILEEIDVSCSTAVTNASVDHLLQLNNLSDVNLLWTSVASESYALLISVLPEIANIKWSLPICNVLNGVDRESLETINYIRGPVCDTNILTRMCPNIIILILLCVDVDLSSLTALDGLVDVRIEQAHYEQSNMDVLLTGIGHRLDQLHLRDVDNVHMTDIVTLCSSLRVLVLDHCTYIPTDPNTLMWSDISHFQNVNVLDIYDISVSDVYNLHLGYYVNLDTFVCVGVHVLSDGFMDQAVKNGAFRNIKHFEVDGTETGDLSMDTVWLLLDNCERLKTLGRLATWRLVTAENVLDLESRVLSENIDLTIIKY
jgi:hypothetical protein